MAYLPLRELCSDAGVWGLAGLVVGLVLALFQSGDLKTTVQLASLSLMIGLVIGAFNFLEMERALIFFLREHPGMQALPRPEIEMSIATRLTYLVYIMILASSIFIWGIIFDEALSLMGY